MRKRKAPDFDVMESDYSELKRKGGDSRNHVEEMRNAAIVDDVGTMERLFSSNMDLEDTLGDMYGKTHLMHAVKCHRIQAVHWLLHHGAKVNTIDSYGITPLMMAAELSDGREITSLLLQAGAGQTIDNQDLTGISALMAAAMTNNVEIIKLLLDNGANITLVDQCNRNALILSVERGRVDASLMLLNYLHPGMINQTDDKGDSALSHAIGANNAVLTAQLMKAGATLQNGQQIPIGDEISGMVDYIQPETTFPQDNPIKFGVPRAPVDRIGDETAPMIGGGWANQGDDGYMDVSHGWAST